MISIFLLMFVFVILFIYDQTKKLHAKNDKLLSKMQELIDLLEKKNNERKPIGFK